VRDLSDPAASDTRMKKTLLGISTVLLLSLGACGKGGVGNLEKLKDEACACKDKACADEVNKKLDEAVMDLAKDYGGKEPDEDTGKKIMGIMEEAGKCIAKLQ